MFQGDEIPTDVILASACLPTLYQAVEIDDPRTGRREAYWDGGYIGNPALYPLFYRTKCPDIFIVHINPVERSEVPGTATEILNRINEISFNASLLRELRNIDFVNRLIKRGTIAKGAMKENFVHSVRDDAFMSHLGIATKLTPSRALLLQLRDAGWAAMDAFLVAHWDDIGRRSTITSGKCSARAARKSRLTHRGFETISSGWSLFPRITRVDLHSALVGWTGAWYRQGCRKSFELPAFGGRRDWPCHRIGHSGLSRGAGDRPVGHWQVRCRAMSDQAAGRPGVDTPQGTQGRTS